LSQLRPEAVPGHDLASTLGLEVGGGSCFRSSFMALLTMRYCAIRLRRAIASGQTRVMASSVRRRGFGRASLSSALAALALCGAPTSARADAARARVVVDMDGRSVRVPEPARIERVAILTSPAVQIAYLLGLQAKLCAVTNSVKRSRLLAEVDPHIRTVPACRATAGQVNLEALLATRPDLCIGSALDLRTVENATRIPALELAVGGARGFTQQIRDEVLFIAGALGREQRARECLSWLDASRELLRRRTSELAPGARPRVFMGFGPDHLITFGSSTFMQEWIEAAGCRNAAEQIRTSGGKEGGLAQVSMEQVLRWAPDLVVLDSGGAAELARDPRWRSVPAVREGRVFRLPTGVFMWNRASFESAVLVPMWLAVKGHPRRLAGVSMEEEARRFYRDAFGFELTDAQLASVLHPER
jgi:iron complex transport system substrate-binding protein